VARKVASLSGDARRALDICRRATEIAQREAASLKKDQQNKKEQHVTTPKKKGKTPKKKGTAENLQKIDEPGEIIVGMSHVTQAHKEMFCSPKIMAIRCCSQFEKFFLQAIVNDFTKTGIEETTFQRIQKLTSEMVKFEGYSSLSISDAHGLLNRLHSMRLVLTEPGKSGRLDMKIRLNVSQDDIIFALKSILDDI